MATLFQLPKAVPISAGNGYAGAKCHFYQAGTTTNITTYTTAALSVAHANPVVADANGVFAPIFIDEGANPTYKMRLVTASGTMIYEVDNVPSLPSQANIGATLWPRTAAEIAAGVTPTNYAYPPGDVRRYGTNTTPGITDMTVALTNALASNNVVYLPGESILISSAISVTDNKMIIGEGSNKTILTTSVNTINALVLTSSARRVNLRDFSITAASVGASNAGIVIDASGGCGECDFHNLRLVSFFTGLLFGDEFFDSTVRNVRADSCTRGFYGNGSIGTSINVVWDRCYSQGHTVIGMRLAAVQTYVLLGCNFGGATSPDESQALEVTTNSKISCISCNFEDHTVANGQGVVLVNSGSYASFDNCTWPVNDGTSGTGYNLVCAGTSIAHLSGCQAISNGSNIANVAVQNTAQLIKHDDLMTGITHSAGSTATSIVRSPYQAQQVTSDQIDLSGAAIQRLVYVPKRNSRVTRIAAIYPEATSADAGITITVRSDDSVYTYASFTSHTSQAQWDVQEITLGTTVLESGRPIIVNSPGGKTGTGEIVIVFEFTED